MTTYDNVTSDGGRYPHAFRPATVQRAVAIEGKSGLARVVRTTYEDKVEHLHGTRHGSLIRQRSTLEWEEEVTVDASEGAKVHISGIDRADEHDTLRVRHGTSTYDGYGSPLEVTASTLHGKTEKTVTTYEVREDDWLIALPRTVTTISGTTASHTLPMTMICGATCTGPMSRRTTSIPTFPMVTSYAHDQEGLDACDHALGRRCPGAHDAYCVWGRTGVPPPSGGTISGMRSGWSTIRRSAR
ncbi:MAG: hypothetical protein U0359_32550 [Byssovorax sp.]